MPHEDAQAWASSRVLWEDAVVASRAKMNTRLNRVGGWGQKRPQGEELAQQMGQPLPQFSGLSLKKPSR